MKSTTNSTKQAQDRNTAFTNLLRHYEQTARDRYDSTDKEQEYTQALKELATACTFSVLKKLCNVGGTVKEGDTQHTTDSTRTIRQLRQTLARDINNLDRLTYASNNATQTAHTQDGDTKTIIVDTDLNNAVTDLIKSTLGDGIDLMQTAVLAIMQETANADSLNGTFLETPYTVRRLKRKVYIQTADSAAYETVVTTPIQEVYRAIRRDVESNRAMQVASHKYTYIENVLTDTEDASGQQETVYTRLPKYSGLAYEVHDFNGKITAITADRDTADRTAEIVASLNLSKQQATILQLRQSGYGYKAISSYMNVDRRNILNQVKRIQEKARKIGLTPDGLTKTK